MAENIEQYKHINMAKVRPIVISGPSGGGKSTLLKKLFAEYPGCFEFSVSHTTRNPRPGETNGKDYHFVTRDEFKKLVDEGGFLEHAEFSGNRYGTSKMAVEQVQSTGKICVLDVEINGVKSIKKTDLNARFIFVQPPSMDELKRRLEGRKTESAESLQRRLDTASETLAYAQEDGAYDNKIINDDLDKAYCKLKEALSEDIQRIQTEK